MKSLFAMGLAAVLVAGCATYGTVPRTVESLPKLQLGVSTIKEVRDALGTPISTGRMPFKEWSWLEYLVTDPMQVDHLFSVYFTSDGVVRETGMVRHPKYDIPGSYQ